MTAKYFCRGKGTGRRLGWGLGPLPGKKKITFLLLFIGLEGADVGIMRE